MNVAIKQRLELWKRKKKAAFQKMQSAIKENNWAEARSQHRAFHHYGEKIYILEREVSE